MKRLTECPVCGCGDLRFALKGTSIRRRSDPTVWSVDRCADCSHGFMNPQPSWEELASFYSDGYDAYEPMHNSGGDADVEVLATAKATGEFRHLPLPEGKRILDVGSGGGFFIRICGELGARATGVEPSATAAERSREMGLDVFNGTFEEYVDGQGRDEKFDQITANHVIEHTPDPVGTLHAMKGALRPGGVVWISVPNSAVKWVDQIGADWHSVDLPYHLQQFTTKSIQKAAQAAGLNVRRIYTYSLPSAVQGSMRQVLRHKYLVPGALGRFYATSSRAASIAHELDSRDEGEAVIVEMTGEQHACA